MRIIAVRQLKAFWDQHPDAEQPLLAWIDEARNAAWSNPGQIKEHYRSASILKNRRVVFNIKGNDYRLVVLVRYDKGLLFVKFVGTHSQYDKINVSAV